MSAELATIIVVTHNSARWLPRLAAALEAQTDRRWRLVVIDNASDIDERPSLELLPAGAELILSAANLGFAEANNQAARRSKAPFLIFLNPDAFPKPSWFANLITPALSAEDVAVVGSTQVRADKEHIFDGAGDVLHVSGLAYRSNYGKPRTATAPGGEVFAACGAAMLARREAFEACGGFDARYFCFFEDLDLCFRLRLRGWRVLQSSDAVVAHVGGGASSTAFADYHGARNRLWTFVKCMPGPLFWPLLPLHLIAGALAASIALLRGRGLAAARGLAAGLAGWGDAWAERRLIQRNRTATTMDVARLLVWNPLSLLTREPKVHPISEARRHGAPTPPRETRAAPRPQEAAPVPQQRDRSPRARSDPA